MEFRIYPCRMEVTDILSVGNEFDNDNQLPIKTETGDAGHVWLNREQVRNLRDRLSTALGDKLPEEGELWHDGGSY